MHWFTFLLILFVDVMSQALECPTQGDVLLEDPLRVAAWNVQRLGKKKMQKQDVVNIIGAIIQRYDIVVMQEVVDSSGEAQQELLQFLNDLAYFTEEQPDEEDVLKEPAHDTYSMVQSQRLGSTRYKEQYVIYYRHERVSVNLTYQYPDKNDTIQMEPFVVVFNTPTVDPDRIAIIPIHTSPPRAEIEIDALVDVYDDFVNSTGVEDAIILGDFNAGCNFVTSREWEHIRLINQTRFSWLVSEHVDTTTKTTSCPYDRIVIAGPNMEDAVYEKSAKPFYFDEYFAITDQEFVLDVSDHYPVEVLLKGRSQYNLEHLLKPRVSITVEIEPQKAAIVKFMKYCLNETVNENFIETVIDSETQKKEEVSYTEEQSSAESKEPLVKTNPWKEMIINGADGRLLHTEFQTPCMESTINLLNHLAEKHPCIFTQEAVKVLSYKLEHSVLQDPSIYNEEPEYSDFHTVVFCLIQISKCKISVEARTNII